MHCPIMRRDTLIYVPQFIISSKNTCLIYKLERTESICILYFDSSRSLLTSLSKTSSRSVIFSRTRRSISSCRKFWIFRLSSSKSSQTRLLSCWIWFWNRFIYRSRRSRIWILFCCMLSTISSRQNSICVIFFKSSDRFFTIDFKRRSRSSSFWEASDCCIFFFEKELIDSIKSLWLQSSRLSAISSDGDKSSIDTVKARFFSELRSNNLIQSNSNELSVQADKIWRPSEIEVETRFAISSSTDEEDRDSRQIEST